jgi:aldehyde:ferredoxin oxidoreductase
MGSKNLKAIAIRGSGGVRVAQPKRFMEEVDRIRKIMAKSTIFKGLSK